MGRTVVSVWSGTFLLEGDRVVRSAIAPFSEEALAERARTRRRGGVTPEEAQVLATRGSEAWTTRDRRLAVLGVRWDPGAPAVLPPSAGGPDRDLHRRSILLEAERALTDSWDPSIHVEEAVRAAADLDRVRNLVGERLGSWVSRDAPDIDPGDHPAAARRALKEEAPSPYGPADASLRAARRRLAELYESISAAHEELSRSVDAAVPGKTPNLSALLGPDLTARLLAQARGLDRLARLPASTVQVLGAERAFFEHLRGNAPPPRHGLLFLHPAIQSAPRYERGKLARALAGKVAIAARLDHAGAAVDPGLRHAFESRCARVKGARRPGRTRTRRASSGKPLHAAASDR